RGDPPRTRGGDRTRFTVSTGSHGTEQTDRQEDRTSKTASPRAFGPRNDNAMSDLPMKGRIMGKLVLMMAVSLDGLVARPGKFGAGGWELPPEDSALKTRKLDWLGAAGPPLLGRATDRGGARGAPHTRRWPDTGPPPTTSTRHR